MKLTVGDWVRILWVPLLEAEKYIGKEGVVDSNESWRPSSISGEYIRVSLDNGDCIWATVERAD